jgi:hypothetical protein
VVEENLGDQADDHVLPYALALVLTKDVRDFLHREEVELHDLRLRPKG